MFAEMAKEATIKIGIRVPAAKAGELAVQFYRLAYQDNPQYLFIRDNAHHMSVKEIARELHITPGRVKTLARVTGIAVYE